MWGGWLTAVDADTGLVRWKWDTIIAARRQGFTLLQIRDALAAQGIDIRYSRFRDIVAQVAKRQPPSQVPAAPRPAENVMPKEPPQKQTKNPVVAAMIEQEAKRRALSFRHDSSPRDEDLF